MNNQVRLFLPLINIFVLIILFIEIWMLDLSNFDDFYNYKYYFNVISGSENYNIMGRDIGFEVILKIISIFTDNYELSIKSVYFAFGLFLLFISIEKFRFIDIHTLSILIFIISNRLYVEGAFNYTRSWLAMHVFAVALIFFYGKQKSLNHKLFFLIFLFVASTIHFQATAICVGILIISYLVQFCSRKYLKQLAISILAAFLASNFFYQDDVTFLISSLNANTTIHGNNYFSLSLIYQFFLPVSILLIIGLVNIKKTMNRDYSVFVIVLTCFITFSFLTIPITMRFSILLLLILFIIQFKNGEVSALRGYNKAAYFTVTFLINLCSIINVYFLSDLV